jgi:hypothetical protein
MPLPRPASPRVLWADMRALFSDRPRHKVLAGLLAVAMPIAIIFAFVRDGQTNIMPGEQTIYVESWPADRSDAEIIAQQKIDQKRREAALAERQRQFQELARRLNIDTE